MRFLKRLSLKSQLWGGFSLVILLMCVIAVTGLLRLDDVKDQASQTVSDTQPAMISALKLESRINQAANDLSLYIINKTPEFSEALQTSVRDLRKELAYFLELSNTTGSPGLIEQATQLEKLITDYLHFQNRIEQLANNNLENFPALKIATETINPKNRQILQSFESVFSSEEAETVTRSRRDLIILFAHLRHNWMNINSALRVFLANPGESMISQLAVYQEQHQALLDKIQKFEDIFTFEEEEAVSALQNMADSYFKDVASIVEFYRGDEWRVDQQLTKNELKNLQTQITTLIDDIVSKKQSQVNEENADLFNKLSQTRYVLLVTLVIALMISIFVALTSSRQINVMVDDTNESLRRMSEGDFTVNLDESRIGEIGRVSAIINNFSAQLKSMTEELQTSMGNLQHASSEMSSATHETSTNIMAQRQETEQVATAVEEMAATAQEIARNAADASESAQKADNDAKGGALISSEALGGMNHLVTDLNRAEGVIKDLQTEATNIGVVLDVIREISEQTNLLALNAAIEAARAGEQGRGFAVVADEVRTLASRTQQSTDQIRDLIEKLQGGSSNAVQAMQDAIKEVNLNNDQVERVAEALGGIAGEITNINTMLAQMAAASEQQSATAEEISRNIVAISELAEKTALGTEHVSNAEADLGNVTLHINNIISNFKT